MTAQTLPSQESACVFLEEKPEPNGEANDQATNLPNVVLLGAGTVGGAFARIIEDLGNAHITQALVRDPTLKRSAISRAALTSNPNALDFRDADVVVEALNGAAPAYPLAKRALNAGVPYLTANKELIACHGEELEALASKSGTTLRYEAAVGAAIPCIRILREALRGLSIKRIYGILNGTSHYVLSEWLLPGGNFESALKQAQQEGYAEEDAEADLAGRDAASKLAIINRLVQGETLRPESVESVSLPTLRHDTLLAAAASGYVVKPLASLSWRADGSVAAWVAPAVVPSASPIANVRGVTNAMVIESKEIEPIALSGPGAGGAATASALYDDLLDVLAFGGNRRALRGTVSRISPGEAENSRDWLIHIPIDASLTNADVSGFLRQEGGELRSLFNLQDKGTVIIAGDLTWREGLFDSLLARGGCVLEVVA